MLLALFAAWAQTPLALDAGPQVEVLYVVPEKVASKRFLDDAAASHVEFAKGDDVRVLYRVDGMVRVRDGEKYGWLPESALSTEKPELPAPPALPISFDIP